MVNTTHKRHLNVSRRIQRSPPRGQNRRTKYVYDDENRLVEARTDTAYTPTGSRWRSTWTYDGLSRARIRTDFTWYTGGAGGFTFSSETRYLYDGRRVIQERNSGNTPMVTYTRGPDLSGSLEGAGGIGGLLARSHGYSAGTWSSHNYYHADGGGNITAMLDNDPLVAATSATYRYDPYGRLLSSGGGMAAANVYRFSSKEVHPNSGLYYYGFRFYDPTLQRWLNRDPIFEAGGVNLYQFVGGDPSNAVDLYGLACKDFEETGNECLVHEICDALSPWWDAINAPPFWQSVLAPEWRAAVDDLLYVTPEPGMLYAAAPRNPVGSYLIKFKSGKTYDGKGPRARAQQSAVRLANAHTDQVNRVSWKAAVDDLHAFMDEAMGLRKRGGPGNNNYNKINSPGEKYLPPTRCTR